MSDYLVKMTLQVGEYEKSATTLVTDAPSQEAAGEYALVLECHGNPDQIEFHDQWMVYDMGGEMAYKVRGVTEITRKIELAILKKYIGSYRYNADDIEEVVNA